VIKNINEIKKNYIRLNNSPDGSLVIEVCVLNWDGPDTPVSDWIVAKCFDKHSQRKEQVDDLFYNRFAVPVDELEKEISKVLNNRRYFQICGRCCSLNLAGHMCNDYMCQSCGSKFEGFVY